MKIAYVSLTDPDVPGGIGTHLNGMARALSDEGNDVTIICPASEESVQHVDGFTVHRIRMPDRSVRSRLAYDIQLTRLIAELAPHLTIYRLTTSLLVSPLFSRLRSQRRIVEINGPTWNELGSESRGKLSVAFAGLAIRIQLRNAEGFVAVTPLLRNYVSKYAPAIEVPNGADTRGLPRHSRTSNTVTLAFTGAFTQWYDIDLVLDSLEDLEATLEQDVRLVLIGDGPRLSAVAERVESSDFLSKRVTFAPWMDRLEALDILAGTTVGLIPLKPKHASKELGSPLKLFDYLAVGVPTVISRLDGCESVESRLVCHYDALDRESFIAAVRAATDIDPLTDLELAELRQSVSWSQRAAQLLAFVNDLYPAGLD